MGLGGPRSGRTEIPVSLLETVDWRVARARRATTGSGGSTAAGTEQKKYTQADTIVEEAGVSWRWGHAEQSPAFIPELLDASTAREGCMSIGTLAAAPTWPRSPATKATSKISARIRPSVRWLIDCQISPIAALLKVGFHGCPPAPPLCDRASPDRAFTVS